MPGGTASVGQLVAYLTANTAGFEAGMLKASASMQALGAKMSTLGATMTSRVSLPLAALTTLATKFAVDFDSAMTRIVSLVGLSRQTVDAWRPAVLELAQLTGRMPKELAEAMFFVTSAGARGKVALDILNASARASAIGLGATKDVAFAAVSATNAYGAANLSAEKAVAILVKTVREGNLSASELAPTLGKVIPIASQLDISFAQLGGTVAAMTRLGLDSATATTSLRQIMATLLKPTKDAREVVHGLGLSFEDLRKKAATDGLIPVLLDLKSAFDQDQEAMSRVFPNIRALTGVLGLVGKNAEATSKIMKSLAQTTESDLKEAFKVAQTDPLVQFKQVIADIGVQLTNLGQDTIPEVLTQLRRLSSAVSAASEAWGKLSPATRQTAVNAGLLLIAFGPLMKILGWMFSGVGALAGVLFRAGRGLAIIGGFAGEASAAFWALAEPLASTAAGFVAISGLAVTLSAAIGALIGTAIRPFVNEALRFYGVLNDSVPDALSNTTAALAENQDQYSRAVVQLDLLRTKLKLTGDAWRVSADWTKENAKRVAELTEKASKLAREYQHLQPAVDHHAEALRIAAHWTQVVKEKTNEANAAYKAQQDALRDKYGVYTQQEVLDKLKEQLAAYQSMKEQNISMGQIVAALGDDLESNLNLAKEYNAKIPEGVAKMATEISEKGRPELAKLAGDLAGLPKYVNLGVGKLVPIVVGAGKDIEQGLAGGFGRGVEQGVAKATDKWKAFSRMVAETPLNALVKINKAAFLEALRDMGLEPANDGSVPR